ncbi:MAG TPA: RDD family protein [Thermoanaerobaculia bacterium]|nr:RDD family protein [Thermoanaerobaculia bacterium]
MSYCQECGRPLIKSGTCPRGHRESLPAPSVRNLPGEGIGELPKARTTRRILGSGVEFITFFLGKTVIAILDITSMFGLLYLILVVLLLLRELNGGALSIAKRLSHMRVVDRRTGGPASIVQAVARNSYYLGLLLLAIINPIPMLDFLPLFLSLFFMFLDVTMILTSPQGRRLGDILAGTQVVEARR